MEFHWQLAKSKLCPTQNLRIYVLGGGDFRGQDFLDLTPSIGGIGLIYHPDRGGGLGLFYRPGRGGAGFFCDIIFQKVSRITFFLHFTGF